MSPDKKIHRCAVQGGKRGNLDGSYRLHSDGVPNGCVQNWRDGEGWHTWCYFKKLTREQKADLAKQAKISEKLQAEEEARRHEEAAKLVRRIWDSAPPAPDDHPYLVRKGVPPHGLRIGTEGCQVPPVMDAAAG